MPYRLTKIYTRSGDQGETTLDDKIISKDDPLIEALGTIDELNSSIGFVLSLPMKETQLKAALTQIQNELFNFGGELYLPKHTAITANMVTTLETLLDQWNSTLPPLEEFLLPRGNPPSAACHVARTVCRRAERCLVTLHRQSPLKNLEMLKYLNRLSDLLFVAARVLGRETNEKEIMWDRSE